MKLLSEARRKLRNVRNSKRRVRILLLTCASVLILFAIITSVVIIHNQQGMKISKEEESRDSEYFNDPIYQEGLSAIKAGEFRKAIRIFESLDDAFPDKDNVIKATYYAWAERSDDKNAVKRYGEAGDYKDAKDKRYEAMYQIIIQYKPA